MGSFPQWNYGEVYTDVIMCSYSQLRKRAHSKTVSNLFSETKTSLTAPLKKNPYIEIPYTIFLLIGYTNGKQILKWAPEESFITHILHD